MRYIEFGKNKALVSEVVLGSMRIPQMSVAEVVIFISIPSFRGNTITFW